jgi:hypothetical protein
LGFVCPIARQSICGGLVIFENFFASTCPREAIGYRRPYVRFHIGTSRSEQGLPANAKYRPHKILSAKSLWLKILALYSRATCLFSRF